MAGAGIRPALESKLVEVIVKDMPEEKPGEPGLEAGEELLALAENCQVLAAGPGLAPTPGAARLLGEIIRECPLPLVLDAGALEIISGMPEVLNESKRPVTITPHSGEMARLTGLSTAEVEHSRLDLARRFAHYWHCLVVLKGARTIVAAPSGKAYFNPTGSPALATAGAGDLLTGLIAGLMARGLTGEEAALAGVYLHGLAGDLLPPRGALAGDLLPCFARAFGLVEGGGLESSPYGPYHRPVRPALPPADPS